MRALTPSTTVASSCVPPSSPTSLARASVSLESAFRQAWTVCRACVRAKAVSSFALLAVRSRAKHPNGQLVTHISADTSFMDWCALLAHDLWLQPAQIIIGLGILIHLIGYSALGPSNPALSRPCLAAEADHRIGPKVGLGVLLVGIPIQSLMFSRLIKVRHEQMGIVDDRVRLLQEILQGIRVIKTMAFEPYFEQRVMGFRGEEVKRLRKNCLYRAIVRHPRSMRDPRLGVLTASSSADDGNDGRHP
jgi:hypothetical protein